MKTLILLLVVVLFSGCSDYFKKTPNYLIGNSNERYLKGVEKFNDRDYDSADYYFKSVMNKNDSIPNYDSISDMSQAYSIASIAKKYLSVNGSNTLAEEKFNQLKDLKYGIYFDSLITVSMEILQGRKNKDVETNKDSNKREIERAKLEKKYEKIFGGSGWLTEKQSKLMKNGFKEVRSGYEACPDGSQQIAMYYRKDDNGFTVNVMLQYSYSIEHHYCRVWVD